MISCPYVFFCLLFVFAAFAPMAPRRLRQALLGIFFTLLAVAFAQGAATAVALAAFLALLTIATGGKIPRAACGLALIGGMIFFKLPLHPPAPNGALPFLAFIPLGFSFQVFAILGFWLDDAKVKRLLGPGKFFPLYNSLLFLPALIAGPYVSASALYDQFDSEDQKPADFRFSAALFSWGLLKKCLADALTFGLFSHLFSEGDSSAPTSLCRLAFFATRIYLDFSGYSDIARGIALQFGIELPQNFSQPFSAKTYVEFWSRWNMSLSQWFKRYLFTPLIVRYPRFKTVMSPNQYLFLCTALACALIAAWHGLSILFLAWYGIVIFGLWLRVRRRALSRLATLLLVFLSTSLILSGSLARWLSLWRGALFGGLGSPWSWILLGLSLLLLFSTQHVDTRHLKRISGCRALFFAAGVSCWLIIFFVSAGGEAPFIYAGF